LIPRAQGTKLLHPGQIVFCVMSENATNEPHRLIAATVGIAIPTDRNSYGYLSEHHSYGQTDHDAAEYAEELAADMLATTLDVEFDPDRSWNEKKEVYKISNKLVKVTNITQSAIGDKKAQWTTVVAGAVFIPEPLYAPE
jgi:arginine decarboxylase